MLLPTVLLRRASRTVAIAAVLAGAFSAAASDRFGFTAFGSFKRMSHTGDTTGHVRLADLPQAPGTWGVGALAGLAGEVLLHDGRLLVSRGTDADGRAGPPRPDDEAALFAAARVQQWVDVVVPEDLTRAQFEAFVRQQAQAHGIGGDAPFPFLVDGRFPTLTWHVVAGSQRPDAQGHGAGSHANKHARMHVFERQAASGRLVGVYSGARLEGVVSHPGERFHLHYVDPSLTASGHVDAYVVAAGAVLKLPVR